MKRAGLQRQRQSPDEVLLLPYQKRWFADQSRFKIGLWARQTGKDFSCAAEAVRDCLAHPNSEWMIIAAGERQALESVQKVKAWARCYDLAIKQYVERRSSSEALIKSAEVQWENGSRIRALPARPETARGYSANVILTEFAFHEDSEELWRAIYPSISNPLRGGVKKLRIVSTPNGRGNKFYDLWHGGREYSRHRVTIMDAVADGLPLDPAELKLGLADPAAWLQEYECEFADNSSVLLPYELMGSCEHEEASEAATGEMERGEIYVGIDFGRKRDLTVCWTLQRRNGILWTREALVLNQAPTPEQVEILRPRISMANRVCLDYTGPGIGFGDYIAQEFGQSDGMGGKIDLCTFTQGFKAELFSNLRMAFEQKRVRIPASRAIREDLHSIQKVILNSGGVSYRAVGHADGHCDRATALALALRAAGQEPAAFQAQRIRRQRAACW